MSSNASTLVGDAGIVDWIEVQNTSDRPIDLTGVALMRQTKPAQAFAFPGGTLQPGAYAVVIADGSQKEQQADGWHAPYRLPASGETLALLDKSGDGIDLVEVPALGRNQPTAATPRATGRSAIIPRRARPTAPSAGAARRESPGPLSYSRVRWRSPRSWRTTAPSLRTRTGIARIMWRFTMPPARP